MEPDRRQSSRGIVLHQLSDPGEARLPCRQQGLLQRTAEVDGTRGALVDESKER